MGGWRVIIILFRRIFLLLPKRKKNPLPGSEALHPGLVMLSVGCVNYQFHHIVNPALAPRRVYNLLEKLRTIL